MRASHLSIVAALLLNASATGAMAAVEKQTLQVEPQQNSAASASERNGTAMIKLEGKLAPERPVAASGRIVQVAANGRGDDDESSGSAAAAPNAAPLPDGAGTPLGIMAAVLLLWQVWRIQKARQGEFEG